MIYIYIISVAVAQMSLLVKQVPSGEEQGETSVFAGYDDDDDNNNNNNNNNNNILRERVQISVGNPIMGNGPD